MRRNYIDLNNELNLRLDIWFRLTVAQRSKLEDKDIAHYNLQCCEMSLFKRVTKSKELHNAIITLKRMSIRLAA